MRQQLLEREPLLAGMLSLEELFDVGIGWRPVQETDCVGERGHAEFLRDLCRQQFFRRFFLHREQRLVSQVPQPALLHTFGCRIDRCERVGHRRFLLGPQQAVLGVNHLETGAAPAHFAEAAYLYAWLELGLLLAGEVEEPERQLASAVANAYEQVATSAIGDFGQQDFAGHEAAGPGDECAYPDELGTILVTERQQEQQVLDDLEPELLELLRKRRADAFEGR